jgi:CheY-like chemotaxis protein
MATILIAEDQAHIRRVLAMWLARHGHATLEAADGCEALEILRRTAIDVLVTDVNMPAVDGVMLTRAALKTCPALRHVFMVTSRCDPQDLRPRVADPRVTLLSKPFSPSHLLRAVQAALGCGARVSA